MQREYSQGRVNRGAISGCHYHNDSEAPSGITGTDGRYVGLRPVYHVNCAEPGMNEMDAV